MRIKLFGLAGEWDNAGEITTLIQDAYMLGISYNLGTTVHFDVPSIMAVNKK